MRLTCLTVRVVVRTGAVFASVVVELDGVAAGALLVVSVVVGADSVGVVVGAV